MMLLGFVTIGFVTRLTLMLVSFDSIDTNIVSILKILGIGLFYDIVAAFYYLIPLVIYLILVPTRYFNTTLHRIMLLIIATLIIFSMLFGGVSEYFFWEEFGKRFNFIAVDYLVYTHEVIKNIQESYPLPLILSLIALVSIALVYLFRHILWHIEDRSHFKQRLKTGLLLLAVPLLAFYTLDRQHLSQVSRNIYNNELTKNGIYSLFSAFRHNELDYETYYKTLPHKQVMAHLKKMEHFDDHTPKHFTSKNKERRYNVILIMVESLSAAYMGIYGNPEHLTPNLDALARKSLFFDNLFATGTRTVRGMEAVALSVPPTPGRSIVKRPVNDTLDCIGDIFRSKGYENKFIYAGYGYFDNMNTFFSRNGFAVIDRTDFDESEISFANVWGVCDEDLLDKTLKEADLSYAKKRPFFSFVMTTSNHRPYTYPEGKIDIPSHSGRAGGVKYTDYAIGTFIKKAKTKPWFKQTVFIIVADHNGGSAGKSSLPLYRYKIPLMIYAPGSITPKTVSKLASQIDTMPTLFSLLGFDYNAKFYGNDILSDTFRERAFIGNYQKLGYVKNGYLYYLTPDKKSHKERIVRLTRDNVTYHTEAITPEEKKEIITYYQSAGYLYTHGKKE